MSLLINTPAASSISKSKSRSLCCEAFYDVAPDPSLAPFPTALPISQYIPAMPLCSSGTSLPQGCSTYSSFVWNVLPQTSIWLIYYRYLGSNVTSSMMPSLTTWSIISTASLASTLEYLRSCLCLLFSPALNTIQHTILIYLTCCHDPVPQSSEHSRTETHISVWGSLCANVTNAIINCALSLYTTVTLLQSHLWLDYFKAQNTISFRE